MEVFPSLDGIGPTRRTLHKYARAVGVIAGSHTLPQSHYWHTSLKVLPDGLITDNIPLPDGAIAGLRLDLRRHEIVLSAGDGRRQTFDMRAGLTADEMGEQLIRALAELGLEADYAREKYRSSDPRPYDPEAADRFFTTVVSADRIFKRHRAGLPGTVGPVQLWPHHFDLSVEWFGGRRERYVENGVGTELPAQLNLGFQAGDDDSESYFYSNPWPFEAQMLLGRSLPEGASWHTEGWQGTILPYSIVRADARAEERLLAYAQAVFELASPTLSA